MPCPQIAFGLWQGPQSGHIPWSTSPGFPLRTCSLPSGCAPALTPEAASTASRDQKEPASLLPVRSHSHLHIAGTHPLPPRVAAGNKANSAQVGKLRSAVAQQRLQAQPHVGPDHGATLPAWVPEYWGCRQGASHPPARPLPSCVSIGKSLNLPLPLFFPCKWG